MEVTMHTNPTRERGSDSNPTRQRGSHTNPTRQRGSHTNPTRQRGPELEPIELGLHTNPTRQLGPECLHLTTPAPEIGCGRFAHIACWAAFVISAIGWDVWAQESQKAKAQAPKDHVELKDTAAGTYFIAKPLKQQYDQLLARLGVLRADIDAGRISGVEATRQLTALQAELEALRREIQSKLVYVPV